MPAKKSNDVPVLRYYLSIVVVAFVVGFLAYFAGESAGELDCELEAAKVDIKNQKEVYESDLEVDSSKPLSDDWDNWHSWMMDLMP